MTAISLTLTPVLALTDRAFMQLCQHNSALRLERTATGDLVIMAPTDSESGHYNIEIATDITLWNRTSRFGLTFDSSSGFRLPNGAIRSPDVAWISMARWQQLDPNQRQEFAPICPDFVIELRSPGDDLTTLQAKMREYRDNGARLGWLIDPQNKRVEIYRPSQAVETLQEPLTLSGGDVLPGLVVNLNLIWKTRLHRMQR